MNAFSSRLGQIVNGVLAEDRTRRRRLVESQRRRAYGDGRGQGANLESPMAKCQAAHDKGRLNPGQSSIEQGLICLEQQVQAILGRGRERHGKSNVSRVKSLPPRLVR